MGKGKRNNFSFVNSNKVVGIWFYLVVFLFVVIDQWSKSLVVKNIELLPIKVLTDVFCISYYENKGVAFGMGDGNVTLFVIVNFVLVLGIFFYFERNKKMFSNVDMFLVSCILAGGIGNLIDRVYRGFVVDFFDINGLFNFPIFNVADILIVFGIFGLMFIYCAGELKERMKKE